MLLIVLDDVNDWVGHLGGHPDARTPAIDGLAARGVAFTNAHCPAPVCRPSRTAMLSGLRASTTPGRANTAWTSLVEVEQTLPAHFGAHGYRLLSGGKVFHGQTGLVFGEHFVGENTFKEARDREGLGIVKTGKLNGLKLRNKNDPLFDWAPIEAEPHHWVDHQLVDWAADRLHEDGDEPLFLAVGFNLPHLPWLVPAEHFDRHPRDEIALPETRADDDDDLPPGALALLNRRTHTELVRVGAWRDALQAYLAALSYIDDQVARLLAALETSPRGDRTIVVLVSDHGWHLGEKRHWRKATLYERSTRIPLVVVTPGGEHAGARCSRPVDSLSVYATLCELAGLPIPGHVEGPSLLPLLQDPSAEWPHLAVTTMRDHHSVRSERYRLTRYADGSLELYDLEQDPGEFENLAGAAELAEVQDDLERRLAEAVGLEDH